MDIAVVGIDGSGKTVLCRETLEYLRKRGVKACYIHVPEYENLPPGFVAIGEVLVRFWQWADERRLRFLVAPIVLIATFLFFPARWKARGSRVILIEHHPHCELPVFGRLYGGRPGEFLARFLARLWRKPDLAWVLSVAPDVAFGRIMKRGKLLQTHETPEGLAYLAALLSQCLCDCDIPQQSVPQAEDDRRAFLDAAFAHLIQEDNSCLREESPP